MVQQGPKHKGQTNEPGTVVAFNRIEEGLGIKPLEQDERHAEADTGQQGEQPTGVDHRARQRGDLIAIEIKVLKGLGRLC